MLMFGTLLSFQIKPSAAKNTTWTAEKQREYANKLKAENLNKEAIQEYEKYINTYPVPPETQANIYYNIGKIAEESGEYENALAYYYKVELIYPETNIKQELGEHIVTCLEKLGRGIDAQYALDKRTALNSGEGKEGKVIARIGKEQITDIQLNKELQKLPEWMREEYNKPDKKIEFLKQYMAMELLWRKARRLGYDKDAEVRLKLNDISKELAIKKLLENELSKKINVTPDQIELYYKANKDKYIEPEKVKIAYVSADTENAVKTADDFKEIKSFLEKGNNYIPEIGDSKEFAELIFNTEPRNPAGPVKIGDKYYVVKVLEKIPRKELSFDEVKDRVAYEYQSERQKTIYKELLEETLKSEDVKIYE